MRGTWRKLRLAVIATTRLILLCLLGFAIALAFRPDWRQATRRAAAPVIERVLAHRSEWRPAPPPAPSPAPETPSPAPEVAQTAEADRPSEGEEAPEEPQEPESSKEPEREPEPEVQELPVKPAGNLPPRLPQFQPEPPLPAALQELSARCNARPNAALYRRLADSAAAAGFPQVAAEAYLKEAAIYRRDGDPNAAMVETLKAGRYRAETEIYLHAEPAAAKPKGLARLEPAYGSFLGAFIDRDDQLRTTFMDENWQVHRDPEEWERRVGKPHASLFCYLKYGRPFPSQWAERLKDKGIVPHLAWEPDSLDEVTESTLAPFAEALARFDAPIFIRFAGEMNGDWTPYHNDPALYRAKFRLVHKVLAARAPKAAMIWCVNSVPEATIDSYYPGDDAVDWVGVNLYNVLFFDNRRDRPATGVHPADLIQPVYTRYAARKPIALCEYAASHQAAIDPSPRPDYAINRLSQLYAALPRRFPRVKLVDWFDCNNLRHARADRQLNNYSVSENPRILRAYRDAVAPDYFLGRLGDLPEQQIRPLREGESVDGVVTFSAWVRSHVDRPRVYILADDQVLYAGDAPGAPVCRWDSRGAKPGVHQIRLIVADSENRKVVDQRRTVRVSEGRSRKDEG